MPKRLVLAAGLLSLSAFAQDSLPDGPEKHTVATVCSSCHELSRVTNSGNDRAGWLNVVSMMRNAGAPLQPDQVAPVADYLAAHFPPRPRPQAVILPGPATVDIHEWDVPTPGSRPHDPLATSDGALWYTGQMANVLGRRDPKTGVIREYKLPEHSGPHGLTADGQGNIWYTANFAGYIGELDPKTGAVKKYPMPDPAARDPHTLVFDPSGILWFTVQNADRLGRLDPKSGEIRLVELPTHSLPYGIAIDPVGIPFFVEFGSNKVGRIDPETMAVHDYTLPDPQSRPRRIAITDDGAVWYTDYAKGRLGRLDPKDGSVKEFASPGGPTSNPYGITAIGKVLWYSESNVTPNTLVRFDSVTGHFQSWKIPSGGGVVRNMMARGTGELALACSGVNKVALVEIR